jgi:fructose/tagatose bisphosphate aldolase
MRLIIATATACLALAACNRAEAPATDANAAAANESVPAAFEIKETSWEFTDAESGKAIFESVDANGNYIANAGAEHFDHGTAVMKDGKACFTSAMTDEGEVCWTDPKLEVGQTGETTSDKGEKLAVKRVEYKPLTM